MGSIGGKTEYDVVLIGAGFGGYTMLPRYVLQGENISSDIDRKTRLRNLGLRVKIFERGSGPGGVW
jgi:cation diffusion facilitator CzcD-associated flavoprotein CzcO